MEPNGSADPSRRISKLYEAHPDPLETFFSNLTPPQIFDTTTRSLSVEPRIKRRDRLGSLLSPDQSKQNRLMQCDGPPADHSTRSTRSFLSAPSRIPKPWATFSV